MEIYLGNLHTAGVDNRVQAAGEGDARQHRGHGHTDGRESKAALAESHCRVRWLGEYV